jgi:hypothetical protein
MDGLMTRTRGGVAAGVVMLAFLGLGAAGCGGDDGGDGATGPGGAATQSGGGGEGGDAGAAEGSGVDVCSLLEVSEIETAFGDRGPVAEGEENTEIACNWEVGDLSRPNSGAGSVGVMNARYAGSVEDALAESRAIVDNPVDVQGLGDEAFIDYGTLHVRSGDAYLTVSAYFSPDVDGLDEKLVTLARHALSRL